MRMIICTSQTLNCQRMALRFLSLYMRIGNGWGRMFIMVRCLRTDGRAHHLAFSLNDAQYVPGCPFCPIPSKHDFMQAHLSADGTRRLDITTKTDPKNLTVYELSANNTWDTIAQQSNFSNYSLGSKALVSAFSNDGTVAALELNSAGQQYGEVFNVSSNASIAVLGPVPGTLTSVHVSAGGSRVAFSSRENGIRVYEYTPGGSESLYRELFSAAGQIIALSRNGRLIAVDRTCNTTHAAVDTFDDLAGDGTFSVTDTLSVDHIPGCSAMSSDGKYLATATGNTVTTTLFITERIPPLAWHALPLVELPSATHPYVLGPWNKNGTRVLLGADQIYYLTDSDSSGAYKTEVSTLKSDMANKPGQIYGEKYKDAFNESNIYIDEFVTYRDDDTLFGVGWKFKNPSIWKHIVASFFP